MLIDTQVRCVVTLTTVLLSLPFAGTGQVPSDATSVIPAIPQVYVAEFVSSAAFGIAMNGAGNVIGTSYPDPGCGPFCLPTLETVVWRNGVRTVIPSLPGFSGVTVRSINAGGWVTGYAG